MEVKQKKERWIGGHFKLNGLLGAGAFGSIYKGVNALTNEIVAVKIEERKTGYMLHREAAFYKKLSGAPGIPEIYYFGDEGEHKVLVLELLGPNLGDLLEYCGGKFTMKTTLMLADQIIERIEHTHSKGFLHRDLKPENMAIGIGTRSNIVYLFDFGLAKCFKDRHTGKHIPYIDNKAFVGTARFASINAHLGVELSRRDDLEALGYVLIYMARGRLPWQALGKSQTANKYENIVKCKVNTTTEQLCQGLPSEFKQFFHEIKNLKFEQKPDYRKLSTLFKDLFYRKKCKTEPIFDWTLKYMKGLRKKRVNPKEIHDFREAFEEEKKELGQYSIACTRKKHHKKGKEEKKDKVNQNEEIDSNKVVSDNEKEESKHSQENSDDETPRLADPVCFEKIPKRSSTQSCMDIPSERNGPSPLIPKSNVSNQIISGFSKEIQHARTFVNIEETEKTYPTQLPKVHLVDSHSLD